ncbi:MAG: S-layer homology domain-containing protein [Clostridia bacterium]|nr:S-layer homology domain-containing protein [Clostridia bacterium]
MKKTNIFMISILIFIAVIAPSSFAFTDTENHWASETIEKMQKYKVINGYTDGSFIPDGLMTRAEFVKVMSNMLKLEKESSKYIPDISRQDWYYSDIRKAVEVGIIQGDTNGYIHPNDFITREEAVVILSRAFRITQNNNIGKSYVDENMIADWAKKEVLTFSRNGYINGYEDDSIRPKDFIKRAEALTVISRVIPNFLQAEVYEGVIHGNTLVADSNVILRSLSIDGSLIIPDSYIKSLGAKNVEVKENLIISNESYLELESIKNINVEKNTYTLYNSEVEKEENYVSENYGIEFSVPATAHVLELSGDTNVNFKENDLVIIDIKKNENYYLQSIRTIAREEAKKYDNLFELMEEGKIQNAEYVLYDDKENAQMLVIKRDSIVYTFIFFNIVSDNLVDNVLSTIKLIPLENFEESQNRIYRNSALSLKFTYQDIYVVVDDSYNTKNVNSGDGFFKLFIQVNTITDMQKYSLSEIKALLETLARNDGEILESKTFKIMSNDAIQFKIHSEEKMIYSLYVVVGNNLYNFIFTGEENAMNEVGETLFENMVNTLEF